MYKVRILFWNRYVFFLMILPFRYSSKICRCSVFCMFGSACFFFFQVWCSFRFCWFMCGSAGMCVVLLVCAVVVGLTREYYRVSIALRIVSFWRAFFVVRLFLLLSTFVKALFLRQYEVTHVYFCVVQRGVGWLSHFHPELIWKLSYLKIEDRIRYFYQFCQILFDEECRKKNVGEYRYKSASATQSGLPTENTVAICW